MPPAQREISAGIIIYKREKDRDGKVETKYLLLYHGRGYWNFPKGKLEKGELSYQAAFREVMEETGIPSRALTLEKHFKMTDKYVYQREGQKYFKIVIFFLAQAHKPEVKVSFEHEGYAWLLHNDAQKLLKHRNIKVILKQANAYLQRQRTPSRSQNPPRQNPVVPPSR
ncbi:MAG: NUDIX domain-containing protein [Patescibacteria group bacterium]|nr:NUDIX domain-containing protein [Patescibacteria group bacterium]